MPKGQEKISRVIWKWEALSLLKGRPAEVNLVHMAPSNVKTKNMAT